MLLALDTHNLYYDLVGPQDGPVVCFAHSLAADGGMWAEQVPALLSAGFRILRLDMRGHGGSTAVPGNYTMAQLSDDATAVIDSLEIKQVHFIGLSIGGMFGQAFALRQRAKVKSLMLCDTSPATPPDAKQRWGPRIEAVQKANSLRPIADGTMDRWLTEQYRARNPRRWKEIRETVIATSPQGYIGCVAAIQDFNFVAELPTIKAPTLVVCGSDDPGAPPDHSQHIAKLLGNARFEQVAGARHFPNVEHPEIFNRLMMDWLGQHR